MTSTPHRTTIEADPAVPTITITRDFDAPAAQVFRAHVEPELVVQWLGPRDLVMEIEHWDARTGGAYRYTHARGDDVFGFFGSFHEVRPGERIVQTFGFDGAPDGVSLETVTFRDLAGGRSRVVGMSVVESLELRDQVLASGMESGVVQGHERLDELLARLASPS